MHSFFTTQQTAPPAVSVSAYVLMMSLLAVLTMATLKYAENPRYQRAFQYLQIFQLVVLYLWYIWHRIPFSNSLPFYHCRLAMFALLLLPNKWPLKQYVALLGVSGAVFALGYPVFDPYDFPHLTSFSFILGHYCLFVNGLLYLIHHFDAAKTSQLKIVLYTFGMDLALVGVNLLTGGNYGLMKKPPIIKGDNILINYLAVSSVLAMALLVFYRLFQTRRLQAFVRRK